MTDKEDGRDPEGDHAMVEPITMLHYPIGTQWHQSVDTSDPAFVCWDPLHREIVLTTFQWESHIEATHPALSGMMNHVEMTIRYPELITTDQKVSERRGYYLDHVFSNGQRYWIKVVVHFDETVKLNYDVDGFVVTSFMPVQPHRKEKREWIRH